MLRIFSTLLFTACIASLASTGWSCSCVPVSFDQRLCLAQTTIEGTVLARSDNCPGTCDPIGDQEDGKINFIVRVDKLITGEKPEDGLVYLKTGVNSALCGIELTVGQKYLFTLDGMQTDMEGCPRNFWGISLCSFPKAVSSLTADETDLIKKLTTGVVSCKDGNIDAFGTMSVTSTDEPASVEASAEPAELDTVERHTGHAHEAEVMMASAEPMLSAEPSAEALDLLTFERQFEEDDMMMIAASAEPMLSLEGSAEPDEPVTIKRRNSGGEMMDEMMAASAEPTDEEMPVESMEAWSGK